MPAEVIHVGSYAALTAYSLTGISNGDVFYVAGGTAINDGGEGEFFYDSGSTLTINAGTILATSGSGRWIRLFSGPVNVKWFGAIGDNSNDDTGALQAAIDYCLESSARGCFLPRGIYRITDTLQIGFLSGPPLPGPYYPSNGFEFFGEGNSYGASIVSIGGTGINFDNAVHDGKTAIIQINRSVARGAVFRDFGLQAGNLNPGLYGMLFANASHSQLVVSNVFFTYVDTAIGLLSGGDSNGEFFTVRDCRYEHINGIFYNAQGQAFMVRFEGGWAWLNANGVAFKMDNGAQNGFGLVLENVSMSWDDDPETGVSATNTVFNCAGGNSPISVRGGRWEHVQCLYTATNSVSNCSNILSMTGVDITFKGAGNTLNFWETPGSRQADSLTAIGCNFMADSTSESRRALSFRFSNLGTEALDFVSCVFSNVVSGNRGATPVVIASTASRARVIYDHCWTSTDTASYANRNPLHATDECWFLSSSTPTASTVGEGKFTSPSALIQSGIPKNLLLLSSFRDDNGSIDLLPWHSSGGTASANLWPDSNFVASSGPLVASPSESIRKISMSPGVTVYQDVTAIDLGATTTDRYFEYTALISTWLDGGIGDTLVFEIVNSIDNSIIYASRVFLGGYGGVVPRRIHFEVFIPQGVTDSGYPRLRIRNTSATDSIFWFMHWQMISDVSGSIYAKTSLSSVSQSTFWGASIDNAKVYSRLQLPFKSDAIGSASTQVIPDLLSDIYISSTTGYISYYSKGKWWSAPKTVMGTAAPTTGTWNIGDQVINSAPSAGGKIGWVCVSTGPVWKAFGAIDT